MQEQEKKEQETKDRELQELKSRAKIQLVRQENVYESLKKELPDHIDVGYDGLKITIN